MPACSGAEPGEAARPVAPLADGGTPRVANGWLLRWRVGDGVARGGEPPAAPLECRRARGLSTSRRQRVGHASAARRGTYVVEPEEARPVLRDLQHAQARGRELEAVAEVDGHADVVADQRLEHVGVADERHHLARMLVAQPLHGGHGARLRLEHQLPAGSSRAAPEGIEALPRRLRRERVERAPGPVPEVDLGERLALARGELPDVGQPRRGLEGALHGAAVQGAHLPARQPVREARGLAAAGGVERHARRAAGERAADGVTGRVADDEKGGHARGVTRWSGAAHADAASTAPTSAGRGSGAEWASGNDPATPVPASRSPSTYRLVTAAAKSANSVGSSGGLVW